jgi:hypothetical protein
MPEAGLQVQVEKRLVALARRALQPLRVGIRRDPLIRERGERDSRQTGRCLLGQRSVRVDEVKLIRAVAVNDPRVHPIRERLVLRLRGRRGGPRRERGRRTANLRAPSRPPPRALLPPWLSGRWNGCSLSPIRSQNGPNSMAEYEGASRDLPPGLPQSRLAPSVTIFSQRHPQGLCQLLGTTRVSPAKSSPPTSCNSFTVGNARRWAVVCRR